MGKKVILTAFAVLMLAALAAAGTLAEDAEGGLSFVSVPGTVHPGKTERIVFFSDREGTASLSVSDPDGSGIGVVRSAISVLPGNNNLVWDGLSEDGKAVREGKAFLVLALGSETCSAELDIGKETLRILRISYPERLTAGESVLFRIECSMDGEVAMKIQDAEGVWHAAASGMTAGSVAELTWDGTLSGRIPEGGRYSLQVSGTDPSGISGTAKRVALTLENAPTPTPAPTPVPTPTPYIPSRAVSVSSGENSYWTLPIGNLDDPQAVWEVMMQPMTVITGDQKDTYKLRKNPDSSAARDNIIGEITCASQGVHVLQSRDDGWTLIEAYNSSYGPNCYSRRGYGSTDELLQGYVPTDRLKTIQPVTDSYGLLIDKLDQKMYIFQDGKIIGSLLISTGQPTKAQPWNETPSGEFLMVSKVGGFYAGNLYCDMAMRINCGCLIHEVPYIGEARDYSSTVPKLGSKASHGCVRVQKDKNEAGQNMKWLWDNIKLNTKVLVWDDSGRKIPYPDPETVVYYNPTGGKYFHQQQYCSSVKSRYLPLAPTTYGALDELFKNPLACPHCCTLMTKAEIDAFNASIK